MRLDGEPWWQPLPDQEGDNVVVSLLAFVISMLSRRIHCVSIVIYRLLEPLPGLKTQQLNVY